MKHMLGCQIKSAHAELSLFKSAMGQAFVEISGEHADSPATAHADTANAGHADAVRQWLRHAEPSFSDAVAWWGLSDTGPSVPGTSDAGHATPRPIQHAVSDHCQTECVGGPGRVRPSPQPEWTGVSSATRPHPMMHFGRSH